jgi:hypothetical protein
MEVQRVEWPAQLQGQPCILFGALRKNLLRTPLLGGHLVEMPGSSYQPLFYPHPPSDFVHIELNRRV